MEKIDVCIPTKNKELIDVEKMNLKILPINKIIYSEVKGLANARNDLMQQVETEWFFFIDDDIIINQQWWDKIKKNMDNDKVGAVNGFGFSKSIILKMLRLFLLTIRGSKSQRGFTSNTLIRTKAIKGIILQREGRLEDMELQEGIKANGYSWVFTHAYCIHMKSSWLVWKEACGDFKTLIKEKGLIGAFKRI